MTILAEPNVEGSGTAAAPRPLRIVLLTGHWWGSRRRAGFHFLAEAMADAGHDVTFATVGVSPMSWLVHDHRRLAGMSLRERPARTTPDGPTTMVWSTPFHPANLRRPALNRLVTPCTAGTDGCPSARCALPWRRPTSSSSNRARPC